MDFSKIIKKIFFLFLLILFFYTIKSFGYETFVIDGVSKMCATIPTTYEYTCVWYKPSDGYFYMFQSDKPYYFKYSNPNGETDIINYPLPSGEKISYIRLARCKENYILGWTTRMNSSDIDNFVSDIQIPYNNLTILYSTTNLEVLNKNTNTYSPLYTLPESYANLPYFLNSAEDIALGEQDLIIMPGDFPNDKNITFALQIVEEEDDGQGGTIETITNVFTPLTLNYTSVYYTSIDNTGVGFYYVIPWSFLRNYLQVGKQYCYVLAYDINNERINDDLYVTYGGLTPADAIKNSLAHQNYLIQEQTIIQGEILNEQQETNEKLDELNNNITDDTITSSSSDLPSVNVNDPTQTGIDNIFQSIYNAFCTGQAQDIVFPIPFTNKNITLSPYYVRDMLNNNGATWVYTLIQAFWGYLIGRYIVKDISKKITKIKGGNIENIENENIKEEML